MLCSSRAGSAGFSSPNVKVARIFWNNQVRSLALTFLRTCFADPVVGRTPAGFFDYAVAEGEADTEAARSELRLKRLEKVLAEMEAANRELVAIHSKEAISKEMPPHLQQSSLGLTQLAYDGINETMLNYYRRSDSAMSLIPITAKRLLDGMESLKEDVLAIEASLIPLVNDASLGKYVIGDLMRSSELLLTQYKEHVNRGGYDGLKKAIDDYSKLDPSTAEVDWIAFRGELEKWASLLKTTINGLQASRDPIYFATLKLWSIYGQGQSAAGELSAGEVDEWQNLIAKVKALPGFKDQ